MIPGGATKLVVTQGEVKAALRLLRDEGDEGAPGGRCVDASVSRGTGVDATMP